MTLTRREFAGAGLAALMSASGFPVRFSHRSRLADSRVEILLDDPIGTIAPEVYGHFVEHLGGVVYDGVTT
jgi:alpha-N-arabinofuranosidase